MKRILFCDIDGTLMDGFRGMKDISARTSYALNQLKKDTYVILTSGRAKCMMPEKLSIFNADGYILSNGAYIECGSTILRSHLFTREQVQFIADYSRRTEGRFILVNQENLFTDDPDDQMVRELLGSLGIQLRLLKKLKDIEQYHFMIEICREEKQCGLFSEYCGRMFSIKRQYTYTAFDVNRLGDNKGSAIMKVLDWFGVDQKNSYCFGDSENDIEMIQLAGHSIAMGNADKQIKNLSDTVTEDVLEEGFYNELVRQKMIQAMQ